MLSAVNVAQSEVGRSRPETDRGGSVATAAHARVADRGGAEPVMLNPAPPLDERSGRVVSGSGQVGGFRSAEPK
jgi:hypothetical protein